MPSVTVHLLLAERVLDRWRRRPEEAPFSPSDPGAVNAFRQGAFGPDLGYFPGGHRPYSDLAHCVRSGDLCRSLVQRAHTVLERSFAWGWVTHVLADQWIHPLIGCAVGQMLHGSPAVFVDGDTDPVAHVRVESGLDAIYAIRYPELRSLPLEPVFGPDTVSFLTRAFQGTYGVRMDEELLLRSHVLSARRVGQGLSLAGLIALTLPSREEQPLRPVEAAGALSRVRTAVSCRNQTTGFLLPAMPPLWLLNAVEDVEDAFEELFMEEFTTRLRSLGNYNLDTGRPEELETQHGAALRSRAFLASAPPALSATA